MKYKRCIFPMICGIISVILFILLFLFYTVGGDVLFGALFIVPSLIFFGICYLSRKDIMGPIFTTVVTLTCVPMLYGMIRYTLIILILSMA